MFRKFKTLPVFLTAAALFFAAPQSAQAFEADLVIIEKRGAAAFIPAAEYGDAEAQVMTGLAYLTGIGAEKDVATGLNWLEKAADENNDAYAQYILGNLFTGGRIDDIAADPEKARRWLQKAVNQGNITAARLLRETGENAAKEPPSPAKLQQKAAQGDAAAQYAVAHGMWLGTGGFDRDVKTALDWLGHAAHKGSAEAQLLVGLRLINKGMTQDGAIWLERAAAQNYAEAVYRLGVYYTRDDMSGQNYGAGWQLLQRAAAEFGDTRAQKILYRGN